MQLKTLGHITMALGTEPKPHTSSSGGTRLSEDLTDLNINQEAPMDTQLESQEDDIFV